MAPTKVRTFVEPEWSEGASMCRVAEREFPPSRDQSTVARHWLTSVQSRWGLPEDPTVELLASELIANAIVHAATPFTVTLAVAEGVAEVAVTDTEEGWPKPGDLADLQAQSGRGIAMVAAMAEGWGVAALPLGKQVWFRRRLAPGWAHLAACPCGGEDLPAARLASGRAAVTVAGPWDLDSPSSR